MRGGIDRFELDEPKIRSIGWLSEPDFHTIEIGHNGVTQITSRQLHCGDYCIYWLEVWIGEELMARYNAKNVDTILYKEL